MLFTLIFVLLSPKVAVFDQLKQMLVNPSHYNFFTIFYVLFGNVFIIPQIFGAWLSFSKTTTILYPNISMINPDPLAFIFFLVPQAATLGFELIFYLFSPLLVRSNSKALLLAAFISLFLRFILTGYGYWGDPWTAGFFPTEMIWFILGIVSHRIYQKIYKSKQSNFYSLFAFFSMIFSLVFFYSFPDFGYVAGLTVSNWLFSVIIIVSIPFTFKLFKNNHFDRLLGDLSYPVYLTHYLFVVVVHLYFNRSPVVNIMVILGLTFFSSAVILLFVSYPIDKLRRKITVSN